MQDDEFCRHGTILSWSYDHGGHALYLQQLYHCQRSGLHAI